MVRVARPRMTAISPLVFPSRVQSRISRSRGDREERGPFPGVVRSWSGSDGDQSSNPGAATLTSFSGIISLRRFILSPLSVPLPASSLAWREIQSVATFPSQLPRRSGRSKATHQPSRSSSSPHALILEARRSKAGLGSGSRVRAFSLPSLLEGLFPRY